LHIFGGDHPLLALLRPSNVDNAVGVRKHLARLVARVWECWPGVSILVRGDSGFCRAPLMRWCAANGVAVLFGLTKNARLLRELERELGPALLQAQQQFTPTGQAAPVFHECACRSLDSWSRERRVVGKAEHLATGPNPRCVVSSLTAAACAGQALYEQA
jgi:hypothetical protein